MEGIFYAKAAAFLGAAIAIAIGSAGPAIGQGIIGAKTCEKLGKYPESAGSLRTTMMIAMGIVESSAIYALVVALLLIFLNKG